LTHPKAGPAGPAQAEQLYREARAGGSAKLGGAPQGCGPLLAAGAGLPVFVDSKWIVTGNNWQESELVIIG